MGDFFWYFIPRINNSPVAPRGFGPPSPPSSRVFILPIPLSAIALIILKGRVLLDKLLWIDSPAGVSP